MQEKITHSSRKILMPDQFPKISVVTACYNQGAYIEDCILSVIGQQYPNLEYIIMDGGSTDNTVDIIKKYEQQITYWVSEKDNGLYDALNRGFQKSTGDIMGWINSDDFLLQKSLFTLAGIFSNNQDVDWIQGHPCVADETGRIVFQRPPRSSKYSFYLKEYKDGTFIQQESTYWRRDLWTKSGGSISQDYRYAGDFELWMRFYKHADQYTSPALIGAFRMRQDQISAKYYAQYLDECDKIIDLCIKELQQTDRLRLQQIEKTKKKHFLYSLARRLGLSNTYHQLMTEKQQVIMYDRASQKFIKAG